MRDPQIENIGWALKVEMESGCPSGRLYLDSLAVSVAARLLLGHSSVSAQSRERNGRLSRLRMKRVLSYIEDNLAQDLSLQDVASFAGLSVSHFKRLFRKSAGLPLHQYLIRRRVERAKTLLIEGRLPISQIALEAGFAHQSHLAHHLRRILGVSPKSVRDELS
jgi:AraC family transcriptional regulator